jgi:hypothetical protein
MSEDLHALMVGGKGEAMRIGPLAQRQQAEVVQFERQLMLS